MWMFRAAWELISGGGLTGVIGAISSVVSKFGDNETARRVAELKADVSIFHDRVDLIKSVRLVQILLAMAMLPPILHQGSIYLDSTPFPFLLWDGLLPSWHVHVQGSWHVTKAPPPYDEREWLMVSTLLGIQSGLSIAAGWLSKAFHR